MIIKKRVIPLIVLAAILVICLWLFMGVRNSDTPLAASGTVQATEAQLGFQAAGRIESVLVREGEMVKSGQELATLDRTEARSRKEQAAAQVVAARAILSELEHGARPEEVAQAQAVRDVAQQRLNDAQRDLERTTKLHDGGAVSREIFDKALMQLDITKSQLAQAAEQLRLVEIGPRQEKIETQRAVLAQADAAVQTMDALLENMTIRATFNGLVTTRHREPGEIVPPGAPVLTVMNRDDRWVRIYIPENRIGALRVGQTATIKSDTYPDKSYHGDVIQIASEAEFTPKTVQTAEERVKLVYAVKVRVTDDPSYELKPGMPADVVLDRSPS